MVIFVYNGEHGVWVGTGGGRRDYVFSTFLYIMKQYNI